MKWISKTLKFIKKFFSNSKCSLSVIAIILIAIGTGSPLLWAVGGWALFLLEGILEIIGNEN